MDFQTCDLCGSSNIGASLVQDGGHLMTSDYATLLGTLHKITCKDCGMVRNGPLAPTHEELASRYAESYQYQINDTYFSAKGEQTRAQKFGDWMLSSNQVPWQKLQRVLEVGCGRGELLTYLQKVLPQAHLEGLELGEEALKIAQSRGLAVKGSYLQEVTDKYDLVFAIAVIEHTPSPKAFLKAMTERVPEGGYVIIAQPVQDSPNHDIFFVDHLFHFHSRHWQQYGQHVGLQEIFSSVEDAAVSGFSMHIFQKSSNTAAPSIINFQQTGCEAAFSKYQKAFEKVDYLLPQLDSKKVATFGVGEFFALARSYSSFKDFPLAFGLADKPENYAYLKFPIIKPEEAGANGVEQVLLTLNPIHNHLVIPRLQKLGLEPIPIF